MGGRQVVENKTDGQAEGQGGGEDHSVPGAISAFKVETIEEQEQGRPDQKV